MDTDRTSQQAGPETRAGRPSPDSRARSPGRAITAGLRVTGAGLLIAAAAIHLDLYLTGYRSIPVIGGLFLLQVIVGFGVGVVVLVTGSRVAAAPGPTAAWRGGRGSGRPVWGRAARGPGRGRSPEDDHDPRRAGAG